MPQNGGVYPAVAGSALAWFTCMSPRRYPMRPSIRAVAVLLVALVAVPLFAISRNPVDSISRTPVDSVRRNLVDDVIRMYKSGVPEEAIIQFVQKADNRFDVSADDLIAMADAKIPRTIIKAVLDVSDVRNGRSDVH